MDLKTKPSPPSTKPEPEIDRVKSSQPLSAQPKPIARLRCSPIPRESTEIHIPKLTDPKKKPRKEVRRKLDRGYQSKRRFLRKVDQYTRWKFRKIRPTDEMPDFWEFEDDDGIEVLLDVLSRLPTEFQDRNEIRWFLASRWEGEVSELHTFVIAAGVWKFIQLHCDDVEKDNGGATHQQEAETGEAAAQRTAESGEQGAERSAPNGAKELDSTEQHTLLKDIKADLKTCEGVNHKKTLEKKRKEVVALWQRLRKSIGKKATKTALYKRADQPRSEFGRWQRGELSHGSKPDKDIRGVLTEKPDWDPPDDDPNQEDPDDFDLDSDF